MNRIKEKGSGSAIYGLGVVGATVYFILNAPSFGAGAAGIFKAIVWPAFLVYEIFKYLAI